MKNSKTIEEILHVWGKSSREIPINNDALKKEILSKVPESFHMSISRLPRRSPYMWMSFSLSVLAVILFTTGIPNLPKLTETPAITADRIQEEDAPFAITGTESTNVARFSAPVQPLVSDAQKKSFSSNFVEFYEAVDTYVPGPIVAWIVTVLALLAYLYHRRYMRIKYDH